MIATRVTALCATLLVLAPAVLLAADEPGATPPAAAVAPTATPAAAAKLPPTEDPDQLELIERSVNSSWTGFMAEWMRPRPVPKSAIVRVGDKYAYPHSAVSFKMEIVKEEGDTVWLRGIPPEDPQSPMHDMWLERQANEVLQQAFMDWEDEHGKAYYVLDFGAEAVPPPFVDGFDFTRYTSGLPTQGRWQMNLVIADMNEDGHDDLVLPPMRKGTTRPFIFIGDGTGNFRDWGAVKFSRDVPLDYGGIAVADFDGDGHLDIALAIHFKTQWVMYGDGAGDFSRVNRLPSPDPRVTSRGVTAADFDGDGRVDLAFEGELDLDMGTNIRIEDTPTVWLVRNTPKGWRLVTEGMPDKVIGDGISGRDLDQDGRPDLLLSSNTNHYRKLLWLNRADGWKSPGERLVLANAYHFDVKPAPAADGTTDVFAAFTQFQLINGENEGRTGIIRYRLGAEGLESREGPIYVDDDRFNSFYRLGVGDLDGNGLSDVVAGRKSGGLEVYLQLEDGVFYREAAPELASTGRPFDLHIKDLDGDGLGDIVGAFAENEGVPGGVAVWLTTRRK